MKLRRSDIKYIALLVVTLVITLIWVVMQPEAIDWTQSYARTDKGPYGSMVLFELHDALLPGQSFEATERPIYNTLPDSGLAQSNYLFVTSYFQPDGPDLDALLNFVATGNTAFIAAHDFGNLADSLGFITGSQLFENDTLTVNLVNPDLHRPDDYEFRRGTAAFHFAELDTPRTIVLGQDSRDRINFVRLPFGEGAFILNTVPLAFTNYNLLNDNNADYACKALSYMPVQPTIWDEYYKPHRPMASSPLRFVLNHDTLKWAWFVALGTLVLFIIFEGRRRQRIIPEVRPPVNSTLDFVETVGRLYFQNADHKNLADKKIAYFLEYLRSQFYVRTNEFDKGFYEIVAEKSGVNLEEVRLLFREIEYIRRREDITKNELLHLQQGIDRFMSRDVEKAEIAFARYDRKDSPAPDPSDDFKSTDG